MLRHLGHPDGNALSQLFGFAFFIVGAFAFVFGAFGFVIVGAFASWVKSKDFHPPFVNGSIRRCAKPNTTKRIHS